MKYDARDLQHRHAPEENREINNLMRASSANFLKFTFIVNVRSSDKTV